MSAIEAMTADEQAAMKEMAAADTQPWAPEHEPAQPEAAPEPVAVEPAADPAPAPEAQQPAPEPEKRTVPLEALKEERQKRQELERKHVAEMARIQERLELLLQAQQAQQARPPEQVAPVAPPVPMPDPERDPIGFVKHQFDTMGRTIQDLQSKVSKAEGLERQITEQQLAQAKAQELAMWGQTQEAEFQQVTPDYGQATQFLRDAAFKRYQALGFTSPIEQQQMLAQETAQVANLARQRGQNLGEVFYNLARASGYSGPQAAAPVAAAPVTPPVAPVAAPPAANMQDALQRAQKGAAMATTVGTAGQAPRGELTAQSLASMSEEEFAAALSKMSRGARQQFFGA